MSHLFDYFKGFFNTSNLKQRGISLNRKIFRFTLFLFLSASLWFINSLRKTHYDELTYPIEFINLPNGKVIDYSLTPPFRLNVKADGFTLARYSFSPNLKPLIVDLSLLNGFVRHSNKGLCISGVALERYLTENVAKDFQILSVEPDTLFLIFTEESVKKVPVELDLSISYLQQYNQSEEIGLSPDSILISGPKSVIDKIMSIKTKSTNFTNVKDSLRFTAQLIIPNNITANTLNCKVVVPVEPFTESKIKVVVKSRNLPSELTVKFFPADITLTCNVAVSKLNTVTPATFVAVVDFHDFSTASPPEKVRVHVEGAPLFVKDMIYSPLLVDYLMEHNR